MNSIKKTLTALSMILGCAAAGLFGLARHVYANETATDIESRVTGGLWRDSYGGLWCGGGCDAGQACCSFHIET
jgi:hypothetical protein